MCSSISICGVASMALKGSVDYEKGDCLDHSVRFRVDDARYVFFLKANPVVASDGSKAS